MRVLIISDIHANLTALEAVLADAADLGYDQIWCLGDLVGYGPDPNECVQRVRDLDNLVCLVGNHDKAALGEIDWGQFNADAQAAIRWTARTLTPESRAYLKSLPERLERGRYTLVHASPRQPIWEYILDRYIAAQNFPYFHTPYCLVGHTHTPAQYLELSDGGCEERQPRYNQFVALDEQRCILNPGSVGQPRDRNPQAAYAVLEFESGRWSHLRAPYDIGETQARMRRIAMPARLIARLEYGW